MSDKFILPKIVTADTAQIRGLVKERNELLTALTCLTNAIPESEIEIARECWGNTNTNVVLHWRGEALKVIDAAGGDLAEVKP